MALAARPTPSSAPDVRTACPVCGGPIHPVAGRCKHCRADLVKLKQPTGAAGSTAAAFVPAWPPPSTAIALGPTPTAAWYRRWPLVVAILAAVAIVVCIGLLVSGTSQGEPRQRRSSAPVMDRMDTQPMPERADPWKGSDRGADKDPPAADPAQPPPRDPDSPWPPPDTAPDPAAPAPAPGAGGAAVDPQATGGGPRAADFFGALTRAACRRLTACGLGSLAGTPLPDICEQIGAAAIDLDLADRLRSGQCRYDGALAARCLRAVENVPCATQTMDFDQLAQQWMSIDDCGSALTCQ